MPEDAPVIMTTLLSISSPYILLQSHSQKLRKQSAGHEKAKVIILPGGTNKLSKKFRKSIASSMKSWEGIEREKRGCVSWTCKSNGLKSIIT